MPTERTQRKPRKLDRAKVVELAEQGLKTVDIAKHQGVAPSTIFRFLQHNEPDRHALEVFKKDRGDVFARLSMKSLGVQDKILDTLDDRIITTLKPHEKGSLLHALNIQAGTLYDKERLERGQSTHNLSILGKLISAAEDKLGAPKAAPATTESAPTEVANVKEDQG
jgi:IS30 family transposase